MTYLSFCVWLPSHSMIFFQVSYIWKFHDVIFNTFFKNPFFCWETSLGCFQFLAVMNKAAMKMVEQDGVYFGYMPKSWGRWFPAFWGTGGWLLLTTSSHSLFLVHSYICVQIPLFVRTPVILVRTPQRTSFILIASSKALSPNIVRRIYSIVLHLFSFIHASH